MAIISIFACRYFKPIKKIESEEYTPLNIIAQTGLVDL